MLPLEGIKVIDFTTWAFATKDREELGKVFDENGILWTPVQTFREAVNDPQAIANGFVVEVDHPAHGTFKNVASPVQLSETAAIIRTTAPELGEHTEEILLEMGYTWEDISGLKDAKVIP